MRSPGRIGQPFEAWWATIWLSVQYNAEVVRLIRIRMR